MKISIPKSAMISYQFLAFILFHYQLVTKFYLFPHSNCQFEGLSKFQTLQVLFLRCRKECTLSISYPKEGFDEFFLIILSWFL